MTAKEYLSQLITMDNAIKSQMKDINGFCGLDMPTVKRGDILRWNLILQYGIFIKCT